MIDPGTRILGLLADGAISVDEAEHLLWAVKRARPIMPTRRTVQVGRPIPLPTQPTLPTYFAGITGDRVM